MCLSIFGCGGESAAEENDVLAETEDAAEETIPTTPMYVVTRADWYLYSYNEIGDLVKSKAIQKINVITNKNEAEITILPEKIADVYASGTTDEIVLKGKEASKAKKLLEQLINIAEAGGNIYAGLIEVMYHQICSDSDVNFEEIMKIEASQGNEKAEDAESDSCKT